MPRRSVSWFQRQEPAGLPLACREVEGTTLAPKPSNPHACRRVVEQQIGAAVTVQIPSRDRHGWVPHTARVFCVLLDHYERPLTGLRVIKQDVVAPLTLAVDGADCQARLPAAASHDEPA